jgi:hypothetical protein
MVATKEKFEKSNTQQKLLIRTRNNQVIFDNIAKAKGSDINTSPRSYHTSCSWTANVCSFLLMQFSRLFVLRWHTNHKGTDE